VDILENIHEMLNEFGIINGAVMWSLDEEWAEFDEIRCFVFKKILETYRCVTEERAQLDLGREKEMGCARERYVFCTCFIWMVKISEKLYE
jgi:hypothetical protein